MQKANELEIGMKLICGRVKYLVMEVELDTDTVVLRNENTKAAHDHTFQSLDEMFNSGLAYVEKPFTQSDIDNDVASILGGMF